MSSSHAPTSSVNPYYEAYSRDYIYIYRRSGVHILLVMAQTFQMTCKKICYFMKRITISFCLFHYGSPAAHSVLCKNKCTSLLCVQIVIATPGRLIEILKQKAVQLHNVKVVVVDEVRFCSSVQVAALSRLLYSHLVSFLKESSDLMLRLTPC